MSSEVSTVQPSTSSQTAADWGIESERSQEFSVGIFAFLMICIAVYTVIVIRFMRSDKGKSLRIGEKIMFTAIFGGILVAIVMAVMQIFYGQLL